MSNDEGLWRELVGQEDANSRKPMTKSASWGGGTSLGIWKGKETERLDQTALSSLNMLEEI